MLTLGDLLSLLAFDFDLVLLFDLPPFFVFESFPFDLLLLLPPRLPLDIDRFLRVLTADLIPLTASYL